MFKNFIFLCYSYILIFFNFFTLQFIPIEDIEILYFTHIVGLVTGIFLLISTAIGIYEKLRQLFTKKIETKTRTKNGSNKTK